MIALVAAVPLETELLRRQLPFTEEGLGPYRLWRTRLDGRSLALLHAGVGKASAAAAAAYMVAQTNPTCLVAFGCGGAYADSGLGIGDLALATEEIFGDEGALTPTGFLDLEELGLPLFADGERRLFHRLATSGRLQQEAGERLAPVAAREGWRLRAGTFVTVSTVSGTTAGGQALARRTGGLCENMEGAAVAQVAALHHIPFLELRGISNRVEDRDPARWDLVAGAERAQRALLALLNAGLPPGGSS